MRLTPDDEAVFAARDRLILLALGVVRMDYSHSEDPHADDDADYLGDQLAIAAREFTLAVHELPADQRPVGWNPPGALRVVRDPGDTAEERAKRLFLQHAGSDDETMWDGLLPHEREAYRMQVKR